MLKQTFSLVVGYEFFGIWDLRILGPISPLFQQLAIVCAKLDDTQDIHFTNHCHWSYIFMVPISYPYNNTP